ncbi:elongin-A3 member D-like [Onychomys torridus]|uniref:elongin-A3 member D-like n=1 Tax=Onychomys torridus TaxID=38674 RepID=UPI00167FA9C0|nr:elongin-A3 member D-like [Onychomys torridus]
MEAASDKEALQELRQHLCTETEPSKLCQSLKKLSSLPQLCDTLAGMDFEQTMRLLRKEQLLVPFAKALAAIWSERSQFGPHPEPDPGDFAFALSLMTLRRRNCPGDEPQESGPTEHRQDGTEVFQESSSSSSSSSKMSSPGSSQSPSPSPSPSPGLGASLRPHTSQNRKVTRSPRQEPGGSKRPRVSSGGPQLASQKQVPVAKAPGSTQEPWGLQEALPISSDSPPSSALRLRLRRIRCKREGKSTWRAEQVLSPGAKEPQGKSESCPDPNDNGVLAGSPLAQDASSLQAGFPLGGQEYSPMYTDQDSPPWARRTHFKTPVYSGRGRARLQQNSQQGRLAEPLDCPWKTRCQDTAEETESWPQEEEASPQTLDAKAAHSQTESATILQVQESPELRLQALIARLQAEQGKKPQGRQTKMIATFQAPARNPGQQAESGPGGAASSEMSSLQDASAQDLPQRAPCPSSRGSNKTQPKKRPAPLMAKAMRDYKKRLSGR